MYNHVALYKLPIIKADTLFTQQIMQIFKKIDITFFYYTCTHDIDNSFQNSLKI